MWSSDNYEIDKKTYNVAIYLRLSDADDTAEDRESESITNQRDYITRYVLDKGWDIYDEYIDDGYTGTNFNRPNFQRMIEDIEAGKVNLVIVKDYSRFGRNYSRAGFYIDEFFPSHNVRFIAINDGIDTFNKNNNNNELSGFKGVMNDMYSADISKKVRTSFNSKRRQGQFIGAFAPYGYIKDPNNKNKLIVDTEASIIVKRIFNMRVNGIGTEEIMRTLNNENILCPAKYKIEQGLNYKNVNIIHYLWTAETVKDILRNPTYIGSIAQRKCERISYKVRKHIKMPRDKWIIVPNTHEPIIDEKTFNLIQQVLDRKSYGVTEFRTEHLLGGLLFCGECGSPITFRREKKKGENKFITLCSNYARFHKCTRHAVLLDDAQELVLNDLKQISKDAIIDKEKFIESIEKPKIHREDKSLSKLISQKEKRKKEIIDLKKCLYEDWKKEYISKEDFDNMNEQYKKEKEALNNEIDKLLKDKDASKKEKDKFEYYDLLKQIVDFEVIPKQILINLIDKVEIFQNKNIKIHYKFSQ